MKDKIYTLRGTKTFHGLPRWLASELLRESEYAKEFNYDGVVQLAQNPKSKDQEGYRIEFINLVKSLNSLARK